MEDRRNVGENSCNSGDGTDQMVQSLMFMMMMMMMMMMNIVLLTKRDVLYQDRQYKPFTKIRPVVLTLSRAGRGRLPKRGCSPIFPTVRRERDKKKMKSSIRIHKPGNQIRRRVSINHSVRIKIKPSYWVEKKERK